MQPNNQRDEQPLSQDLLIGAAPIAEFLGLTERQARHQIDNGAIPVTRMGRLIIGSKRVLRRRFSPLMRTPPKNKNRNPTARERSGRGKVKASNQNLFNRFAPPLQASCGPSIERTACVYHHQAHAVPQPRRPRAADTSICLFRHWHRSARRRRTARCRACRSQSPRPDHWQFFLAGRSGRRD